MRKPPVQNLHKLLAFKRKNNPRTIRHQKNGRLHIQQIYPKGAIL